MPFWTNVWEREIKHFLIHFLGDMVKTFCILAALLLFWAAIRLLPALGYPEDLLSRLDQIHFAFMWTSLLMIGVTFILKLGALLWRKKR